MNKLHEVPYSHFASGNPEVAKTYDAFSEVSLIIVKMLDQVTNCK